MDKLLKYLDFLMRNENGSLMMKGLLATVRTNKSIEEDIEDTIDIGYGHKLSASELSTKKVRGYPLIGGDSTYNLIAFNVLVGDVADKIESTYRYLEAHYPTTKVTDDVLIMLTDYNYTGVLHRFPKFTTAVLTGDVPTMLKEYKRYYMSSKGRTEMEYRNSSFYEEFLSPYIESLSRR